MRSPAISRLYLQVRPGTTRDSLTEDQIWAELDARLLDPGDRLVRGPIIESTVVTMRSFMCEPMSLPAPFPRRRRSTHRAAERREGLNLAVADAALLADAMACWYDAGSRELLDSCGGCRSSAWLGQEFSAVMTDLLHELDSDTAYERRFSAPGPAASIGTDGQCREELRGQLCRREPGLNPRSCARGADR